MLVLAMEFSRSAQHRQSRSIRAGGDDPGEWPAINVVIDEERDRHRRRNGTWATPSKRNSEVRLPRRARNRGGSAIRFSEETAGTIRLPPGCEKAD